MLLCLQRANNFTMLLLYYYVLVMDFRFFQVLDAIRDDAGLVGCH